MALKFERYVASEARDSRDVVRAIYERSYVEFIKSGNEFDSVEAFMDRFDSYSQNPSIDLLIAWQDREPVGQAWGWPLGPQTAWWSGLRTVPDDDFTAEDGTRTFALSEIMVAKEETGRGIAHSLHDELLVHRSESRATLLAEPDNPVAYRAYVRWGWQKIGELDPGWQGAPTFDVMILDLIRAQPLMRASC